MDILILQGDEARRSHELAALADAVFDGFDASYITKRLDHIHSPVLHLAVHGGDWVGFKLAYERGDALYSWLGGVRPEARGKGVARRLMRSQHQTGATLGYKFVETRTRASNNPMIILNLQSGFEITGFEVDRLGIPVVMQRKRLA